MDCKNCGTHLISEEDLCFYYKNEKSVHLIIKSERSEFLESKFAIQEAKSKKKDVTCGSCQAGLGKKLPIGPNDYWPLTFGNDKVTLFGMNLNTKEKWHFMYTTEPYNQIRVRNDDTFFENLLKPASPPKRRKVDEEQLGIIKFPDPQKESEFTFEDSLMSDRIPRDYQVTAYIEALQRDLIVVLPTGYGKTLIASLVTVKMLQLNPNHMVLFIVDRVPLVFQQGEAISMDTHLEVCALSSENHTYKKKRELINGEYQVLVATAGAYAALECDLGIERFCCVIMDECHHALKGHVYVQVLGFVTKCDPNNRPRILGLTASPPNCKGSPLETIKLLAEFRSNFSNAPICHNLSLKTHVKNDAQEEFYIIPTVPDQCLIDYQNILDKGLVKLAVKINEAIGPNSCVIKSGGWNVLQNRGNLTRVLDILDCYPNDEIAKNVKSMKKIFQVLQTTELLGVTADAHDSLEDVEFYKELNSRIIHSPRVSCLFQILDELPDKSKVIVFVKTRKVAQILSTILKENPKVDFKFSPMKIVGQYGPLGMSWEREQDEIIKNFRDGNCNLLVSTSVLEEGQDIPCCDVVIRFDGIQTLISYTQSKGRARNPDSHFKLILSEREHKMFRDLQAEEELVKDILESHHTDEQIPSDITVSIREHVQSQFAQTNSEDFTLRSCECAVELYLSGTLELFDLQDHISDFFKERYFLTLHRIELVKPELRWKTKGIFPIEDSLLTLGLQTHTRNIYQRYRQLTSEWNFEFEHISENIWTRTEIFPTSERTGLLKKSSRWEVCEILFGKFQDRNTFSTLDFKEFEEGETTFELNESYMIIRTEEIVIEIALVTIHRFILTDWTRKNVRLYIPLIQPPEIRTCKEGSFRLTSLNNPVMRNFGEHPVFGICLTDERSNWNELWVLLHSSTIFPVPLFETRVKDNVVEPMDMNGDILKTNPNYDVKLMQDTIWLFYILQANRNVCLPIEILDRIKNDLSEATEQELSNLNRALLKVLIVVRDVGTHYFLDFEKEFYDELKQSKTLNTKISTCKENYCHIECAMVTPSRLIPLHPILTQCNRLFRKYPGERFLNLAFRDENEGELDKEVTGRIEECLTKKIIISGSEFHFLVCSSSQLRSKRAIFIQMRDLNPEEIQEKIRTMRKELIGKSDITNETKFLSRLGLFCTSDKPTVEIDEAKTFCMEDLKADDGLLLTDGAGKIKKSLAREVLKIYGSKDTVDTASALQIRLAGLKGVLTIVDDDTDVDFNDPRHQDHDLLYRDTMKKIQWTHSTLCIVKVGKWNKLSLNIQMLNLLTSLNDGKWDPKPKIRELHEQELNNFAQIFIEHNHARKQLQSNLSQYFKNALTIFDVLSEPFLLKILRCIYTYNIKNLIEKVHIPIPRTDGCILMGIPDPIGVLDDGEVFITYIDEKNEKVVKQGRMLVYKNPCLHPGDLLVPTAVDKPELRTLHNVIVFPIRGSTSLPACSGGGDLDGDEFAVIWNEDLIPPESAKYPPQNYDEVAKKAKEEMEKGEKQSPREVQDDPKILERLSEGYIRIVTNDLLGVIAHYHLAICDQMPDGARDPLSISLSQQASLAVDSPKTGITPEIPEQAKKLIKDNGYPDFMEKRNATSFPSEKLLGDLYHSAQEVCFKSSEFVNILKFYDNHEIKKRAPGNIPISSFEIPGYHIYLEDAEKRYYEYSSAFQEIMLAFGIETEAEVVTALIIHCHPLLTADKGKTMNSLKASFEHLTEEFREIFHSDVPKSEFKKKAAAWYLTVYRMALRKRDETVLHSFAWLVPEHLIEIESINQICKDVNSSTKVHTVIGKTGKEYLLEKHESIRTFVDSKLKVLYQVEEAINPPSQAADVLVENPKNFDIVAFGSTSVYLCELQSDLDISVSLTEHAKNTLPERNELTTADLFTQRKHILNVYISPRILNIADQKTDKMEIEVPIVSFTVKPIEKKQAPVNVDITVESDGVLKANYIKQLYVETGGVFFAWMWLLVHWARHAGILKCHNSPDSSGIILTAEFEALVLFIYGKMEHKAEKVEIENLDDSLESLMDAILKEDSINQILGSMLEEFFYRGYELTSKPDADITYTWPVQGAPTHTIYISALKKISALLFQGWHCLVFTRDISKLFERSHTQFHIHKRFSHRMSGKIKMSIEFFRKSLSDVSGAKIEIQDMGNNILLTAYGSAEALHKLMAEISALEADTALSKRYRSNANHYMMEGCVTMAMANSSQNCKVKLDSFKENGCYKQSHFNNDKNIIVPKGKERNKNWKNEGIAKIKSVLCNQLSRFPKNDENKLEKLQLKTRFGFFYVLDARHTLQNEQSLPLEEFQKSLEKDVKKRDVMSGIEDLSISDTKKSSDTPNLQEKKENTKSKSKKSLAKKTGLSSAFCPGIHDTPSLDEAKNAAKIMRNSLIACEFEPIEKSGSYTWRVDLLVSLLREVRFNVDENLKIIDFSERPVIWLLSTIIGDRRENSKAHDVRIRAECANPLDIDSKLGRSILQDEHISSLFTVAEDGSPEPCESLKARMRFIKHNLETTYYKKEDSLAKISYGVEYGGDNWKIPRHYCELSMYHNQKELGELVADGNSNNEIQALADKAINLSLAVSEHIAESLKD